MTAQNKEISGLIIRAQSGFYYVRDEKGEDYACKARGLFRKDGVSPLVGDMVRVQRTEENTGMVTKILPRRNYLVRPPVANIDLLVLVVSVISPPPNLFVLDKLLAIAAHKKVPVVLALTKIDLDEQKQADILHRIYESAGISVYTISSVTGEGIGNLITAMKGKVNVFCGNTGAGKTSLLNCIDPSLHLATGEISQKLGRGRHTTRHAQLYPLADGGYIADTPGFSAVEMSRYEIIRKEELQDCFEDFAPYKDRCRFRGCSHTCESGCAVLAALQEGKIAPSRMESYKTLYEEARQIKEWEK